MKKGFSESIVGTAIEVAGKYTFNVGPMKVLVYRQGITDVRNMDAVVNASNDKLEHVGGIAGYIARAAGPSVQEECTAYVRKHGVLKVPEVFISKPGKMNCRAIIHAVGPRWAEYAGKEDMCAEALYTTVLKCLDVMHENQWRHVAICAIGSGKAGIPTPICTAMYMKAFEDFARRGRTSVQEIHFVDVNENIVDQMKDAHRERMTSGSAEPKMALKYSHNKTAGGSFTRKHNALTGHDGKGYDVNHQSDGWEEVIPEKLKKTKIDFKVLGKKSTNMSRSVGKDEACAVEGVKDTDSALHKDTVKPKQAEVEKPTCPVCMTVTRKLLPLDCSHNFCKDCLKKVASQKPVCPVCGVVFGVVTGTQPDGRMFTRTTRKSLPGYERAGTIEICYVFEDGVQKSHHPNPGKPYQGISRTAYLPDNRDGREVLELLKKAFSRRLIFTIGDSRTTGKKDQITWNDIHHKTSPKGGPFSYPDGTYLKRVKEELAAKGITG